MMWNYVSAYGIPVHVAGLVVVYILCLQCSKLAEESKRLRMTKSNVRKSKLRLQEENWHLQTQAFSLEKDLQEANTALASEQSASKTQRRVLSRDPDREKGSRLALEQDNSTLEAAIRASRLSYMKLEGEVVEVRAAPLEESFTISRIDSTENDTPTSDGSTQVWSPTQSTSESSVTTMSPPTNVTGSSNGEVEDGGSMGVPSPSRKHEASEISQDGGEVKDSNAPQAPNELSDAPASSPSDVVG
jgi:hypothetical protein